MRRFALDMPRRTNKEMREERILVVEDEVIVAAGIEEMLRRFGYSNIECAGSESEAKEFLEKRYYDLVLLDVNLGNGGDGINLVKSLIRNADVPVIYLTGNTDRGTINRAKHTAPFAFIAKPVSETNLRIQVDLFMRR